VLTTLGIDILGGLIIAAVWLLIRRCRGDEKKDAADNARGSMSKNNITFHETVVADWSMKNGMTFPPKTTTKKGRRKNFPGANTMHPGDGNLSHIKSSLRISTHTSNFFGDKNEELE